MIITRDNSEIAEAQTPLIISASRSTDIPAFYADWFFKRLEKGYAAWTNPFNGVRSYISFAQTRFIVFWSKNPRPLLHYLPILKERNISCYIQFTLNDYEAEGLERGVPSLEERISTFQELASQIGKERVIWRFDPLLLTDDITVEKLLQKIEHIGDQLQGFTEKLVFSFADIAGYRKVKANLEASHIHYHEFTEETMRQFAEGLTKLNQRWNYTLATCGEKIDLAPYGIQHNRCVDDELIGRIAYKDHELMKFLGLEVVSHFGKDFGSIVPENAIEISDTLYLRRTKDNKDKGQRILCGCVASKDIGQYNTCPHLCEYCYANASKQIAVQNWKRHKAQPFGESIIG